VIALLQRVSMAQVVMAGATVGAIEDGLLVLLGVEAGGYCGGSGSPARTPAEWRVFSDDTGKMNLSLRNVGGGLQ